MLEKRWDIPTEKFHAALGHRWRYARIIDTASTPALRNGLHYAGDANGKSRVESSWLDGLRIAENLLANIA
jgi:predicted NAD/FAD-dependent oxidoreductase